MTRKESNQRNRTRLWGGLVAILALGAVTYIYFVQDVGPKSSPERVSEATGVPLDADPSSGSNSTPDKVLNSLGKRVMVGEKAFLLQASYSPIEGDALEVVESLVPAAEAGDPAAAFNIYLKANSCRSALDNRIDGRMVAIYKEAGVDPIAAASAVESTLGDCERLYRRSDLLDRQWLEMAAKNGSIEAKLLYAVDVSASLGSSMDMLRNPEEVARYKRQAVSFLKDAANAGSVDALISLSGAYDTGLLVEESRVLAYAYYAAAQMASPGSVSTSVLAGYQRRIDKQAAQDARRAADAIYRKCCSN